MFVQHNRKKKLSQTGPTLEQTCREHQVNVLDCTTACVCSDVPDAMLVRAQAASNCREGLQNRERETKWAPDKYAQNKSASHSHDTGLTCHLCPDSAPGWAESQTWSGRQWEGYGHSTAASCKMRSTILFHTGYPCFICTGSQRKLLRNTWAVTHLAAWTALSWMPWLSLVAFYKHDHTPRYMKTNGNMFQ